MADMHTDWEHSVFARQPGLGTERLGTPQQNDAPLASEEFSGTRPLGQILKAIVNGQIMEFKDAGPLLAEIHQMGNSQLSVPGLVPDTLPQADPKTGRQKRIQDFAVATHQGWLVIGPLTQIVFLAVAPDNHLRLVNFYPAPNGQPALLLYHLQGAEGQIAISAPGPFRIQ